MAEAVVVRLRHVVKCVCVVHGKDFHFRLLCLSLQRLSVDHCCQSDVDRGECFNSLVVRDLVTRWMKLNDTCCYFLPFAVIHAFLCYAQTRSSITFSKLFESLL